VHPSPAPQPSPLSTFGTVSANSPSFAAPLLLRNTQYNPGVHMRAITQVAFGPASTALRVSFNDFVCIRISHLIIG
jgi:hypothetical protein